MTYNPYSPWLKTAKQCKQCERWFMTTSNPGHVKNYCSHLCKSRYDKSRRPKIDSVLRNKLLARDKFTCQICKRNKSSDDTRHPHYLTVDHIVPIIRGGTNEMSNLQIAHAKCNVMKGGS